MSGEIEAAVDRLKERKAAASIDVSGFGEAVDVEVFRRIWSGLDLDMDEVLERAQSVRYSAFGSLSSGMNAVDVVAGYWFDGIATGLLIAEARAREEARS